jgi:hypothetical protein
LFCEEQKRKIPMSEKHLLAKIAALELAAKKNKALELAANKKIAALELAAQKKTTEIRKLRHRNRDLTNSRASWKAKYQASQEIVAGLSERRQPPAQTRHEVVAPSIEGHKYDLTMVSICLSLYFFAGCSLRGVKRVLLCLQLNYGYFPGELPSKSSIDNWIQKVGYDDYKHIGIDEYVGDYSIVIDESMVVGQQRMMVVLGLPSAKTSDKASDLATVRVLYLAVRASWKAPDVVKFLKDVIKKMGKPPLYVISDGGNNLKKGIKDSGLVRLCDVGHEIAKFVEQTYKHQEVFKAFSTAVAGVKFREVMKDTAYLLPPKQRAIARFMNLTHTVDWAKKMLVALPKLTPIEQQTFAFLKDYQSLINDLSNVFEIVHQILKIIKNKGISYENIEKCLFLMKEYTLKIPNILTTKITKYFKDEKEKLTDKAAIWHASSDVIESLFGKFKQRSSTNKLNGVTPLVLSLGLYGQFQDQNAPINDKIKDALQDVSMADLNTWKQKYLIQNQVVRRNKTFKM